MFLDYIILITAITLVPLIILWSHQLSSQPNEIERIICCTFYFIRVDNVDHASGTLCLIIWNYVYQLADWLYINIVTHILNENYAVFIVSVNPWFEHNRKQKKTYIFEIKGTHIVSFLSINCYMWEWDLCSSYGITQQIRKFESEVYSHKQNK